MSESVIIVNGTNTIKAGFSDDDTPRVIIPTVLGRPTSNTGPEPEEDNEQLDIFVGEEGWSRYIKLILLSEIRIYNLN